MMNNTAKKLLKGIELIYQREGENESSVFGWMLDYIINEEDTKGRALNISRPQTKSAIIDLAELYEAGVKDEAPLTDILGEVYQAISCKYAKKGLGQYFTPAPLAAMMANLNALPFSGVSANKPIRILEPSIGSGVMMLETIRVMNTLDKDNLERTEIVGVDLDMKCCKIAFIQLAYNEEIHNIGPGSVKIFHGNALSNDYTNDPKYCLGYTKKSYGRRYDDKQAEAA